MGLIVDPTQAVDPVLAADPGIGLVIPGTPYLIR
jgi:hypothetical protein